MDSHPSLSNQAKQSFQAVSVIATVMVVLIHYQSATTAATIGSSTVNGILQEFLCNGLCRVAVPCFALAAGLFYFRSDDGSWSCYCRKCTQRARTVLLPYFIVASIAITAWLVNQRLTGDLVSLTPIEFLSAWVIRPPAEQLWFLRDLMVLVTLAPVIGVLSRRTPNGVLALTGSLWLSDVQPFPVVGGWYALNNETLFFFCMGSWLVARPEVFDRVGGLGRVATSLAITAWLTAIGLRMVVSPIFDNWYVTEYTLAGLLIQRASIVLGSVCLFRLAWAIRGIIFSRLAGTAFFVYLIHEFPLRAVAERVSDRFVDPDVRFWLLSPLVVIGCFLLAEAMNRWLPWAVEVLTGGRTINAAQRLAAR
ncbi:MAG: acyltransferase [Planctomycetota bacterium]